MPSAASVHQKGQASARQRLTRRARASSTALPTTSAGRTLCKVLLQRGQCSRGLCCCHPIASCRACPMQGTRVHASSEPASRAPHAEQSSRRCTVGWRVGAPGKEMRSVCAPILGQRPRDTGSSPHTRLAVRTRQAPMPHATPPKCWPNPFGAQRGRRPQRQNKITKHWRPGRRGAPAARTDAPRPGASRSRRQLTQLSARWPRRAHVQPNMLAASAATASPPKARQPSQMPSY